MPLIAFDSANQLLSVGVADGTLHLPIDAEIAGKGAYYADPAQTVPKAETALSGDEIGSTTTLADGGYRFALEAVQDCRMTATKTIDAGQLSVHVPDLDLVLT